MYTDESSNGIIVYTTRTIDWYNNYKAMTFSNTVTCMKSIP